MLNQTPDAAFTTILGPGAVATDIESRTVASSDLYSEGALCSAVLKPQSIEALAQAVKVATDGGFAILPKGAGLTYVSGYTSDQDKSVVVDTSALNRIIEINAEDMYITVEAGVTWKQINDALAPLGLRLPFFGTFSGTAATVGGGLSNGAMFLGSARYGSVAEIILGLEVVTADGSMIRTGQHSVAASKKPFFRTFGPDLTGLFVHDCGAFGIKAAATFRLIKAPKEFDYLSFLFPTIEQATQTLSEIARNDLVEEIYIVDPVRTRQRLQDGTLLGDISMLSKVISQEKGLLRGLKSGFDLIKGGKNFLDQDLYSVHLVCAGRTRNAVAEDIAACRAIAQKNQANEIPNSIPKATRAMPFPDLGGVLGTEGDRWAAINCKVAHSDALPLIRGADAIFARNREALKAAGVEVTLLISAMSNHVFSYECVFRWFDQWLPLHRAAHPHLSKFTEPDLNVAAREIIAKVRQEVLDYFFAFGAASSQIGRTYHYLNALTPETQQFLISIKKQLDPHNRMNPGVLGFTFSKDPTL